MIVTLLFSKPPPAPELGVAAQLWAAIPVGGRVAVVGVAAILLVWLLILLLRKLGKSWQRTILWAATGLSLVGVVVLAAWARTLPQPRGSYFVLWHQFVRVGAALCGTGFVVGAMGLSLPAVLKLIASAGFTNFVAVRHVRASKSGFLTVISGLSIAGVGVSSFALCAVVSFMGGFGADLPAHPDHALGRAGRADGLLHHPQVLLLPAGDGHRAAADHAGAVLRRQLLQGPLADNRRHRRRGEALCLLDDVGDFFVAVGAYGTVGT